MTLVQGEDVRVVFLGQSDHRLTTEGACPFGVHSLPADGGGGGAGPVQCVPGPVVCQALHRAHIYNKQTIKATDGTVNRTLMKLLIFSRSKGDILRLLCVTITKRFTLFYFIHSCHFLYAV